MPTENIIVTGGCGFIGSNFINNFFDFSLFNQNPKVNY